MCQKITDLQVTDERLAISKNNISVFTWQMGISIEE
jgi:hypothetical protein